MTDWSHLLTVRAIVLISPLAAAIWNNDWPRLQSSASSPRLWLSPWSHQKGKWRVPFSNLRYLCPIFSPGFSWKDVMNIEFLLYWFKSSNAYRGKRKGPDIKALYHMYGYVWPLKYNWWFWFRWPFIRNIYSGIREYFYKKAHVIVGIRCSFFTDLKKGFTL